MSSVVTKEEVETILVAFVSQMKAEFNELHLKVDDIAQVCEQLRRKITSLEARSSLRVCILCELEDNLDGHPSYRCPVYPDTISKVQRLAELDKCHRCLKARHGPCEEVCSKCVGPHNFLLCSKEGGFKRARHKIMPKLAVFPLFSLILVSLCHGFDVTINDVNKRLEDYQTIQSQSASVHSFDLPTSELLQVLKPSNVSRILSDTCREDLHFTLNAIHLKNSSDLKRELIHFTLPLLDSWAKLPAPGFLRGYINVEGRFLECRNIDYYVDTLNRNIKGEYYRIFYSALFENYNKPKACGLTLSVDICLPKSCAFEDLTTVFQEKAPTICEVRSTNQKVQKADAGTWIVGSVIIIFTAIALMCSVIDYFVTEESRDNINPFINGCIDGFSFHRNVASIFKVKQVNKQTGCLNCIRFFSISWVICGHMLIISSLFSNNPLDVYKYIKTLQAEFYMNGFYSVDTFFFMSGFLVAFTWFKLVKTNRKLITSPMSWVMFYVHRYLRLSPPYFFIIFAQAWVIPTLYRDMPLLMNPMVDGNNCKTNIWVNLLYLNNFVKWNEICFPPSWYLSVDMQLYIASPVILIVFGLFGTLVGMIVCLLIMALSIGLTFFWVYHFHLPPALFALKWGEGAQSSLDFQYYMYYMPLVRLQPYLIGMIVGYILQTYRHIRFPKIVVILLWIISLGGMVGLILSGFSWNTHKISLFASACNNAFSRSAWALCLSWILIACYYEQAGPIGDFMNWEIWYPLGRLSYAAYLTHWPVMLLSTGLETQQYQFRDGFQAFLLRVVPMIVYTFGFSIYWSAVFERPFAKLETLIFAKPSVSPSRRQQKVQDSGVFPRSGTWDVEAEEQDNIHVKM